MQNTAQQLLQITMHIVLLFWFKADLGSNLRALNLEKISRGKMFSDPPKFCVVTHAFIIFKPEVSSYTGLKCKQDKEESQKKFLPCT